jgi:drug/metabolite transporter (DMT)-like permease
MENYLLLLLETITSISVSLAVLYALSRPLMNVLNRVCPDEQAATFWLSYTKIMLLIAPLLLVLTMDLFAHFSDPLDSWRFALIVALGGILIGLYTVGERLGRYVTTPQKTGGAS